MNEKGTTGALTGIRVIDLTRVLGGPYCTQILGDHGADVIKIEPPQGDETRTWGPPFLEDASAYFLGVNRNKRGIVLDLSKPEGREALLKLLEQADVLVENFKQGTLEKWGIGYTSYLQQRFPNLIHCRISGFGTEGPLRGLPGYDAVIQAISGLMSVNGEAGGDALRIGVPVVDIAAGLNATIGILLALQARHFNGQGQSIDIALYDCGISLLHPHLVNFLASGKSATRGGNAHPNITPYDTFRTATGPIFLAVGNDGQFKKLCAYLNASDVVNDSRFATNVQRNLHRSELKKIIEVLLASHDGTIVADQLMRAGVPCGPVLSIDEVVDHPHTQQAALLIEMPGYRGISSPIKLSRNPASYRRRPPGFGEHDEEILGCI